ncbi:MAG TPA: sigma-54 dependent transcriptional regulator [Polyangiaceae bacterium]|nr:sigma-54 dependent transcriptional regulator [Polyangiaceae bacterium]
MKQPLRVLVVDDEKISRVTTVQQLEDAGYVAAAAESGPVALDAFGDAPWDVVLADLRMPGMDGLELMRELRARHPGVEIIVMTAYGTVQTAVAAMRQGAVDYLTKPFSFVELDLRLKRLEQLADSRRELSRLRAMLGEGGAAYGIVGRSPAMLAVLERIPLFAASSAPVLVTGETGTGKELVAQALHEAGARRLGPFVAVACGAVPSQLAESELFGHEKGAFTGAVSRRRGLFEQASGGTLLLDDVDDLAPDIQVKLLRVLQEGTLRRVGATEDLRVDVRVVATTKVGLAAAVQQARFRQDLFYRLCGLEIALPPLRQRGDDVVLLAQHFLNVIAGKSGEPPKVLSQEFATAIRRYTWPGNVRELWRVVESCVVLCRGPEIRAEHMPASLATGEYPARLYTLDLDHHQSVRLTEVVEQFEDDVIQWALRQSNGQQTRAAERLGIARTTLQSKLGRQKK